MACSSTPTAWPACGPPPRPDEPTVAGRGGRAERPIPPRRQAHPRGRARTRSPRAQASGQMEHRGRNRAGNLPKARDTSLAHAVTRQAVRRGCSRSISGLEALVGNAASWARSLLDVVGAPERIRTSDPQIRSLVLYPAELRARAGPVGLRGDVPAASRCLEAPFPAGNPFRTSFAGKGCGGGRRGESGPEGLAGHTPRDGRKVPAGQAESPLRDGQPYGTAARAGAGRMGAPRPSRGGRTICWRSRAMKLVGMTACISASMRRRVSSVWHG